MYVFNDKLKNVFVNYDTTDIRIFLSTLLSKINSLVLTKPQLLNIYYIFIRMHFFK